MRSLLSPKKIVWFLSALVHDVRKHSSNRICFDCYHGTCKFSPYRGHR
jgi:hypothetical protein